MSTGAEVGPGATVGDLGHIDGETLIALASQVMSGPAIDMREPAVPDRVEDTVGRILAATMACLERFGVAKTTIDDVAREAGCSRATIYRNFPNRTALVSAAVDTELACLTVAVAGRGRPGHHRRGRGHRDVRDRGRG